MVTIRHDSVVNSSKTTDHQLATTALNSIDCNTGVGLRTLRASANTAAFAPKISSPPHRFVKALPMNAKRFWGVIGSGREFASERASGKPDISHVAAMR